MLEINKPDIKYNLEDIVKANLIYSKIKHPFKSRLRLIFAVMWLIFTLIFIAFYFLLGELNDIVFLTFALCVYNFYSYSTFMKRAVKKKGIPDLKYVINDEGFREYDSNTDSFFKWENFTNAIYFDDFVVALENKFEARMFLHSSYTDEEFSQLKEWIKAKVKVEYRN